MRLMCPALALLLLALAPGARAHFVEGQIFLVDANRDQIIHMPPGPWTWRPVFGRENGVVNVRALTYDAETDMLVAQSNNVSIIYGTSSTGSRVIEAEDGLDAPEGPRCLALDGYGWIYVSSSTTGEILKVRPDYHYEWVFADAADGIVHATAMAFVLSGDMLVANNGSGGQVLSIDRSGNATVWDTIPGEEAYSLVVRPNGDVYVGCDSGNIYKYAGGSPGARAFFGNYGTFPCIDFAVDGSVLYQVGRTNNSFRTIDPDTGVDTVVATGEWTITSMGVVGSQVPPGSFRAFGATTVSGTGNMRPEVHGDGNPRIGGTYRIEMHDFLGNTQGYLYSGIASDNAPFAGGIIYVDLTQSFTLTPIWMPGNPGAAGEGDYELAVYTLPNDPLLVGTDLWFQGMADDPMATGGLAMSHGLRMWIGD